MYKTKITEPKTGVEREVILTAAGAENLLPGCTAANSGSSQFTDGNDRSALAPVFNRQSLCLFARSLDAVHALS